MNDDTRRIGSPREPGLSDAPTGPLRAPATLAVEVAGRTDKGRVRPGNEDAFGLEPPNSALARAHGTLLVVSDGMGGHAAGEVASNLAVDTIKATYYRDDHSPSTADAVEHAISAANSAIFNSAEEDATRSGMGCTVVVMVVQGTSLTVGHVGDSRGYLIRGGRAHQITRDHSWVAMQVAEGVLTPEQAEHHPNRSLLMRALGRQPSIEVELSQHQLQPGDVLLLCSDGLTGVVNDAEIAEYAGRYAPQIVADQLVTLANQRGAPDNVTVVTAAVAAPGGAAAAAGTTQTMAAPIVDAITPRIVQAPPGLPTSPTLRGPAAATIPPVAAPIGLAREPGAPRPMAPVPRRRGRRRLLAGSLAAFGLAAGLVLLTLLGPRAAGDPDTPRATETAVASRPAATPTTSAPAAPAATVPPPVATGIPGLIPPTAVAAASPPPIPPAAPPALAPPQAPVVTATPPSVSKPVGTPAAGAASQPGSAAPAGAEKPSTSQATPLIPSTGPSIFATATATATVTPATSGADAPPQDGAAASADPAAGAPSDGTEGEPNPDAADPAMTEEPGAAEPSAGETAAQEPPAAQPPPSQPAPGTRFIPGTGIPIPSGFPSRPSRKPNDD